MNEITSDRILYLGYSFWRSKVLFSAVELGVFTKLAKEPLDAKELANSIGIHYRGAEDFFDALVALKMLCRDGKLYKNTPETDLFLDSEKPSYIGNLLELVSKRLYPLWNSFTEALRTGKPQQLKNGENLFTAIYRDPNRLKPFLSAMTGLTMGAAKAITEKFPWKNFQTFVDIGTAQGHFPVQVALSHSHLSGGGFDLPSVGSIFTEYVDSFHLNQRLKFYPGDFFEDQLPSADVIVMGHILHDWNLEEKLLLITKAYKALPQGGHLLVYDTLIDDDRSQNAFGLLMSLDMLIETQGGFDYTGGDCTKWMLEVGFQKAYVKHLTGAYSMVVGIK